MVLADAALLDLGVVRSDPWMLAYEGFDPAHEGHREALTTLGNGYVGVRGAAPEHAADRVHYPGTYLAGVYNRLTSTVQGREVENEHLVNAPNWLWLDVCIDGGGWWSTGRLSARWERRELDLRRGVLTRQVHLVDEAGRCLEVTQRRLVSMQRPHVGALETTLRAQGWSGRLGVRAGIDGGITNANVAEYGGLASRHLDDITAREADPDTLVLEAITTRSRITIATAARTTIAGVDQPPIRRLELAAADQYVQCFDVPIRDGQPIVIDKTVAIYTSRDRAIATPALAALEELERSPAGVDGLLPGHAAAWDRLWDRFRIGLNTDRDTQLVLNLHLFHLLQTISPHTAALDTGVPARGLHGEGYRGHVFWDELFVLPVITGHLPGVARALLDYRWRRLDAARHAAAQAGLAGALFPWQSGSDGREETPAQLFNPALAAVDAGQLPPPTPRRPGRRPQRLAVLPGHRRYCLARPPRRRADHRGGPAVRLAGQLRPERRPVPHQRSDGPGRVPRRLPRDSRWGAAGQRLHQRAGRVGVSARRRHLDRAGRARLQRPAVPPRRHRRGARAQLSRRLAVPWHADGVISQFDGYAALAELDWARYRAAYGNIGRLDLILEAEGDSTHRYKLAKQADVLMLIYLLGPDELLHLLAQLGYRSTPDDLVRTVDYYLARTAHGPTLSRVVHASVLARVDPARAWATFRDALAADLDDTQGGTTREGIHLGAMAGSIDIVTRAFAGLQVGADPLTFTRNLPEELHRVEFGLQHRDHCIDVTLDHHRLRLAAHPCAAAPVDVQVDGVRGALHGGQVQEFDLAQRASSNPVLVASSRGPSASRHAVDSALRAC